MLPLCKYQLLPSSLLLFLALAPIPSRALDLPWPLSPREPAHHRRQDSHVATKVFPQSHSAEQIPMRVRKMSGDEGEMFFPEYWSFEVATRNKSDADCNERQPRPRSLKEDKLETWTNASMVPPMQAPFALHTEQDMNTKPLTGRFLRSPRDIFSLDARDFKCPGDSTACTSINRPNSCCPNGSGCEIITDTGLGDVGCCGGSEPCGGEVSSCPAGDTPCPGSEGGGCCIAGYSCSGVGCAVSSTVITTVQPVVTAAPPPSSSTPPSSTKLSSTAPSSTVQAVTSISTSTFTAVTSVISTATSTSTQVSSTTPKPTTSASASTSATVILPVRPTSSALPIITTTAPPLTVTASTCPTGFYQCSAYYHAGCCRVGRDCGLTSCPAASPTLAINSNGVTVSVIPSATGDAALGASGCAGGWFTCAAEQGGGCCPSGYACGTSCTATAVVLQGGQTGTATVAKDNGAGDLRLGWWILVGSASLTLLQLY